MKVGVIGAMEVEVELIKQEIEGAVSTTRAGMTFVEGTVGGVPVVVAKCGIGKVNAGMCVQVMCDLFGVTHVINTGIAGSLDPSLDIGDMVVSVDALYHDFDLTPWGYAPGKVPDADVLAFEADESLAQAAVDAAHEVAPGIHVLRGRVVSGDQFISDLATKARLVETFGGSCCEMEGAAIAHACHQNGVSFVIVRVVSDKADGGVEVTDRTFETTSAHRCAGIVTRMLKALAA